MKAIELIGDIDEQHRLRASVPEELPAGPVRLIVFWSEEDEAGAVWSHASRANRLQVRLSESSRSFVTEGCHGLAGPWREK
jgi:hypothetical protein